MVSFPIVEQRGVPVQSVNKREKYPSSHARFVKGVSVDSNPIYINEEVMQSFFDRQVVMRLLSSMSMTVEERELRCVC